MRFVKIILVFTIVVLSLFTICGCGTNKDNVVRIHIRANSNIACDQDIKLVVRDSIVSYITPLIAGCHDSKEVIGVLSDNLSSIESVANNVLLENGFEYVSSAEITNEYFPTRQYNDYVFPADFYDALIINLGSGCGNNWWCVAYPPLCFVGTETGNANVRYKSKLVELINVFLGR